MDLLERCDTCRFWKRDEFGRAIGGYHCDGGYSPCVRRAPVYAGTAEQDSYFAGRGTHWPYTAESDWCGDYEALRGRAR